MAVGGIVFAVAKWALGIGATVVAGDLLNDYYQKNKGKIGKTFSKWVSELGKTWQDNYERDIGSARVELLDQPKTENTSVTPGIGDKEQTNGMQGSMDYTDFNKWLQSAEGKAWLEQAEKTRLENTIILGEQQDKEAVNNSQGAMNHTEQSDWVTSAAGQEWLANAEKIRLENEDKEKEGITSGEKPPNQGETNDDEEKEKFDNPYQPDQGITDKTDENLGTNNIQVMDWMKWAEEEQAKRWARDDAIMYATWEREDTAWQRGVEDMRKSGVNPNLVGAQPAASGGGITQSSGQNLSGLTTQMNVDLDKMQQLIDQAFKGSENDKDRFMDLFGNIIQWIAILSAFKKGK